LLLLVSLPALGQENGRALLVGVLLVSKSANPEPVVPLLRKALAALGYVEGRNLRLDFRFTEGHADRFPALAKELAAEKAGVIVARGAAGHAHDPDRGDRRRHRHLGADPEHGGTGR
jgi:hypothetical protein